MDKGGKGKGRKEQRRGGDGEKGRGTEENREREER